MAKFRIKPASLQKVTANFKAATEKKIRRLTFAFGAWGDDVVAEIGDQIVKDGAVDQGLLHAATTRTAVARVGSKLKLKVFNAMEYAVIEELGRKPGGKPPPILPIIGWAARHGMLHALGANPDMASLDKALAASAAIVRNVGHGGGKSGARKKPLDPIVRDLVTVRLIARKIAQQGVRARHSFSIAWDRKTRTFAKDLAAMVR